MPVNFLLFLCAARSGIVSVANPSKVQSKVVSN